MSSLAKQSQPELFEADGVWCVQIGDNRILFPTQHAAKAFMMNAMEAWKEREHNSNTGVVTHSATPDIFSDKYDPFTKPKNPTAGSTVVHKDTRMIVRWNGEAWAYAKSYKLSMGGWAYIDVEGRAHPSVAKQPWVVYKTPHDGIVHLINNGTIIQIEVAAPALDPDDHTPQGVIPLAGGMEAKAGEPVAVKAAEHMAKKFAEAEEKNMFEAVAKKGTFLGTKISDEEDAKNAMLAAMGFMKKEEFKDTTKKDALNELVDDLLDEKEEDIIHLQIPGPVSPGQPVFVKNTAGSQPAPAPTPVEEAPPVPKPQVKRSSRSIRI